MCNVVNCCWLCTLVLFILLLLPMPYLHSGSRATIRTCMYNVVNCCWLCTAVLLLLLFLPMPYLHSRNRATKTEHVRTTFYRISRILINVPAPLVIALLHASLAMASVVDKEEIYRLESAVRGHHVLIFSAIYAQLESRSVTRPRSRSHTARCRVYFRILLQGGKCPISKFKGGIYNHTYIVHPESF